MLMDDAMITKRLVYHIGGYDPATPERVHRRFVRELRHFEMTWSVKSAVSEPEIEADQIAWNIDTAGPNWRVHTGYRFVRWDDVMESFQRRPTWQRIPLGLLSFVEFIFAGALWGYLRTNWRYALFFLYPFLLVAIFAAVSGMAGLWVARAIGSALLGAAAAFATFVLLIEVAARWTYLAHLFDLWIFSRDYIHGRIPALERRLDRIARELVDSASSADVDEILVLGHSFGAVLCVDLLGRALKLAPTLGERGPRIAFLSVGSSILKIGLHRGAVRLRADLTHIAAAPGLFWGEYQALTDVMNFYKSDPMRALRLPAFGRPHVRVVRIRQMLSSAAYRRLRRNFYRVHNQFISGNDRRTAYDYFMLVCGPLSAESQVRLPDGAGSAISEIGALSQTTAYDAAA